MFLGLRLDDSAVDNSVLWWAEFSEHEAYLQTAPSVKLCGLLIEIAA